MRLIWILTLLSSVAFSAGMGKNMPSFSYFDTNVDGKISEKELNDGRAKRHAEMAAEGRMLRNAQTAPSFSQLDTNNDGHISKEEFKAHQDAMGSNQ